MALIPAEILAQLFMAVEGGGIHSRFLPRVRRRVPTPAAAHQLPGFTRSGRSGRDKQPLGAIGLDLVQSEKCEAENVD